MHDDYGFTVDASIASRWSPTVLQQISANVWPVDCQSCGRSLGLDTPTLVVSDLGVAAAADLHHPGCRASGWDEQVLIRREGQFVSYRTFSCMLPVEAVGGHDYLPLLMINPSLEQVVLRPIGSDWEIATVANLRECGLTGIEQNNPSPDTEVTLDHAGIATVRLHRSGQHWRFDCNVPGMLDGIHAEHGLALGVTTAYVPELHLTDLAGITEALRSGQVATGWIPLR